MKKINLKKLYYPHYTQDYYVDVTDEIADELAKMARYEHAYHERIRYHKAYYSLDCGDGIENSILMQQSTTEELYEKKVVNEAIYAAIIKLSDTQARRIYAHFFEGKRKSEIAGIEGVSETTVYEAIKRGLKNMTPELRNYI